MLLRLLRGEWLVAERGGEDHLVALADQVLVDRDDVGTFGDWADGDRLDAKLGFEVLPRPVPLQCPARPVDGVDPDERDLQLLAAWGRCGAAARSDYVRNRQ